MVIIKGIEKLTLIDYPGHIASILFLGGCNFRCDYCYNKDLVLRPHEMPTISQDIALEFINERRNFIDAVVVTGGEPTLQINSLLSFLPQLKSLGLKIKLDSNGYFPDRLEQLVKTGTIDYIAMDIKAPLSRYSEIVGAEIVAEKISQSVSFIMNSSVDYEFRTTVWQNSFTQKEFESMFQMIQGAKNYYLQNMYPCFTIQPKNMYHSVKLAEIQPIVDLAKSYVGHVALRGEWV